MGTHWCPLQFPLEMPGFSVKLVGLIKDRISFIYVIMMYTLLYIIYIIKYNTYLLHIKDNILYK